MQEFFPQLGGAVLDVGCGRKPYRHLVPARSYIGLDLDTPELRELGAADLFYAGGKIPAVAESFEAIGKEWFDVKKSAWGAKYHEKVDWLLFQPRRFMVLAPMPPTNRLWQKYLKQKTDRCLIL